MYASKDIVLDDTIPQDRATLQFQIKKSNITMQNRLHIQSFCTPNMDRSGVIYGCV